ncbi:MAG TPA: HAD-IIIA family hydrolase [Actinomycetota bacterium]|jgi:D-glycero-D-manno-heptose 1,7-bisphosphate phosphatase
MSRRAALVDRDGTINVETPGSYVLAPDAMRLLPGAAAGLRRLHRSGLAVVVISNQAPVGRGWIDGAELAAINRRMEELLAEEGAGVDAIYSCPHDGADGCRCRKPEPGLLLDAAADLDLDLAGSFVVGDKASDLEAGRRVGATTILVRTGQGSAALADADADHVADDLDGAAAIIGSLVEGG